jgi:hypothetical protein
MDTVRGVRAAEIIANAESSKDPSSPTSTRWCRASPAEAGSDVCRGPGSRLEAEAVVTAVLALGRGLDIMACAEAVAP